MARRSYAGTAKATVLVGAINASATSITVADGTGYPTGAAGPFVITIDAGNAAEEKVLVTSRTVNTFTVSLRGWDGTSAAAHSNAAGVQHTISATDLDEANAFVNGGGLTSAAGVAYDSARLGGVSAALYSLTSDANAAYVPKALVDAAGDLIVGTAADTVGRLAKGSALQVLRVNAAGTALEYATPSGVTVVWLAAPIFAATSGSPVIGTVAGGRHPTWYLDAATTEQIASSWDMPSDWTTVHVDLFWTNVGAGAGNVRFDMALDPSAVNASLVPTAAATASLTATAAAQNILTSTRMFTGQALTSTDFQGLRLSRDGANAADTLANDVGIVGVQITKAS